MNKPRTSKLGVLLLCALITAGLINFNVIWIVKSRNLEAQFESLNLKCEAKGNLVQLAYVDETDYYEKLHRYQTVIEKLITHKDSKQLESTDLLTDQITTIIAQDKEFGSNVIKFLTNETEKLEAVYEITHLVTPPKTRTSFMDHGAKLDHYQFVFPLKPQVWNVFGINLHGEGELSVVSVVDGEIETVGSLPEFAGATSSRMSSFLGKIREKPDSNGNYYVAKPYGSIKRPHPTVPNDTETLQIDLTIRKATQ